MHAFIRHLAVRLWTTVILGGVLSLWLLPWFQGRFGLDWLVMAAGLVFLLCFLVLGVLFRHWGSNRISALIQAAAGFERDGMSREALTCYHRALAHLDSFLMSPRVRRKLALPLARQLVRFHIASADRTALHGFIPAYLNDHPEDVEVAEFWVKQTEQGGGLKEAHQDLAARISSAHPDNCDIQRVLAEFFLFLERTDYPALLAYRCVWDAQPPPGIEFRRSLGHLFMRDRRVDEWSLEAYLALLGSGPPSGDLREALAACIHLIPDSPAARAHLATARQALADLTAEEIEMLCDNFRPRPAAEYRRRIGPDEGQGLKEIAKRLSGLCTKLASTAAGGADRLRAAVSLLRGSARARRALVSISLVFAVAAVGLFGWNTLRHLTEPQTPPAAEKIPPVVEVTDPFTLQVAAYLSLEYAKQYVAELKNEGLDAYWSTAVSGSKKWYQVRISHFATKAEALRLGESLKAKGLIDDFYVANYSGAKQD
jgi:signal transduction histidine kinase